MPMFNDLGFVTAGQTPSGILAGTVADALVAAGTTQANALALTANTNVVATTAASTGVVLPTPVVGAVYTVKNNGASTLNVFPPLGGQIDAAGVNAAVTLATTGVGRYVAVSATQFRAV